MTSAIFGTVSAAFLERLEGEERRLCDKVLEQIHVAQSSDDEMRLKVLEEAFQAADSFVEHAYELLTKVAYFQVSKETRSVYEIAAICKAYVLCLLAELDDRQASLKEALRCLDQAIIIAGSPLFREETDELISILLKEFPFDRSTVQLVDSTPEDLELRKPVKILENEPSLEWFIRMRAAPFPFIIRNYASDWPALDWNNLADLYNHIHPCRTVPVELGSKYTDEAWTQSLMAFGDFVEYHILRPNPTTGYLAQYDLFVQVPRMKRDVIIPDYCYTSQEDVKFNCWIGPKGTISPLHQDPHDNLFVQVVGYKYVKLYPEEEKNKLQLFGEDSLFKNTSQVPHHPCFDED